MDIELWQKDKWVGMSVNGETVGNTRLGMSHLLYDGKLVAPGFWRPLGQLQDAGHFHISKERLRRMNKVKPTNKFLPPKGGIIAGPFALKERGMAEQMLLTHRGCKIVTRRNKQGARKLYIKK